MGRARAGPREGRVKATTVGARGKFLQGVYDHDMGRDEVSCRKQAR